LSSNFGGSALASRAAPFLAWSQATCTWRPSANISGASRQPSSTAGSTFFAAMKAAALSSTPDSALRPISKTGRELCDIENGMATGFLA